MPEDQSHTCASLERLLDDMEDYSLQVQNYQTIQKALESTDNISIPIIKKILLICDCDLKADVKSTLNGLNILRTLLMKIKETSCLPLPDLLPSAVVVLRMLKTTLFNKVESIKMLCFEIMNLYPDETLISLVVEQSNELTELFNLYCQQRIPLETRIQPIGLITTLLKILPPDKKATFVKDGFNVWFSKIIPTVMLCPSNQNVLEALELLTEEIVKYEYSENLHWQCVLSCIYTATKYPAVMKSLLEQGNEAWHRMWIVFIKLLKSQITQSTSTVGSPINSMLPVVETAFKMDVANRCRAFKCWNVLIDNFSSETNEVYIKKRIKLLIIPLLSNNAKVEETALAKLKTWWHLIKCFYRNMNSFSETILVTFLNFCFGKPSSDKLLIPGMISNTTKTECVKVFINIVGHGDCNGCVEYPKLTERVVNSTLLANHWAIWIHSLTTALKICIENNFKDEHIECVWKSFIMIVGELPDNSVRRDLFNEILALLEKLPRIGNRRDAKVIHDILIPTLFDNNDKIRPLLKGDDNSPVTKIITALLRLSISDIETDLNMDQFRNMTDYILNDVVKTSIHTIEYLLNDLSSNNILLWIALSQSICYRKYTSYPRMLSKMLLWPFKYIDTFVMKTEAVSSWMDLYNFLHPMLHVTTVSTDILNALLSLNENKHSRPFILNVTSVLVQQQTKSSSEENKFDKEAQLLYNTVINLNEPDFISILPVVSDVIANICINLTIDEKTAKNVVLTAVEILKKVHSVLKTNTDKQFIINNLKKIFESLEKMFKMEKYCDLKLLLTNDLKNIADFTKTDESLNKVTTAIYKSNTNDKFNELIKAFENDANTDNESSAKKQSGQNKFPTPSSKVSKKNKKIEASIVNTVVEDGEEFVVVKSNWKFNPRKLTDNQKEKLQRKREDIPALYQDLSQSQDEFKLTTWKSDSMDTSTGSKSASVQGNGDANNILKNMPNTEFVPKMLENMINKEKDTEIQVENKIDEDKLKNNDKFTKVCNKDVKSPRVALKDRVFRNVRNLIEKSNVSENANTSNIMSSVSKTPTMTKTKLTTNVTNSAPSKINADRPSRVKRKPKKFDDLQGFSLKKRRHSSGLSDSPSDGEITDSSMDDVPAVKDVVISDCLVKDNTDLKDKEIKNINEEAANENTNKLIILEDKGDIIEEDNNIEKELNSLETQSSDKIEMDTDDQPTSETKEIGNVIEETTSQTTDSKVDVTPKAADKNKTNDIPKSSNKKSTKKSRIEKELAIDMVEGHPYLQGQSKKRLTRKAILKSPCTRMNMSLKSNRNKTEPKSATKSEKKAKDLNVSSKNTQNTDDIIETQDVIESSQESTVSTISVKATKINTNKTPIVLLEKTFIEASSQSLLSDTKSDEDMDTKDIEFPRNKTAENSVMDLTDNMDTETFSKSPEDVITIIDEPLTDENNKDETIILETQNTAEAETQSIDQNAFVELNDKEPPPKIDITASETKHVSSEENLDIDVTNASTVATADDVTKTMTDSVLADVKIDEACSSFKDEEQRKQDFLNNTLEISPIKILSPVRDKKSPSPETSSDYVVVKLSSPVNIDGEPFNKCESPEIFTEDKESVNTRDLSPPREEIQVINSSPRSSLSLKKTKPQVRQGGRGAQMLGLCVPDRIQTIITSDKSIDNEDTKKSPSLNTSARRNLRILISSSNGDNHDGSENKESEESAMFLKFERSLPPVDSSPSVPILKRKLAEITDDATASPASKRKRVSFHDPPVSTTICVKKYIEPCGVRSPQISATQRQERRSHLPTRSPKRLDNVFKLDSILTKTVESFNNMDSTEDTEMSSPDETPVLEVIKPSDLNDTDPICLELVSCDDPITNIAEELSSPTMKTLLIKELEDKVTKIGDLAKMTELEINRLCIKAPKVEVAKRVLTNYFANNKTNEVLKLNEDKTPINDEMNEPMVPDISFDTTEAQTNEVTFENMEIQTDKQEVSLNSTQTDCIETSNCSAQTDGTLSRTTADIVTSCLERDDFVDNICEKLDEAAKQKIADNMSLKDLTEVIMKKVDSSNCNDFLNRIIEQSLNSSTNSSSEKKLSLLQDYLCNSFDSKELILLCSNLLREVHEKPV